MRSAFHSRRSAGISLLGVLLSLCCVALLAIWAIPAYFSRDGVTLDNLCMLLARDIRSAQNRATLLKQDARFEFDRDGWRAFDASGAPLLGGGESLPIERRFSVDGVFEGVEIERIDCGENGSLRISARGVLTPGGELVLFFKDQRRTIQIVGGSGQVVVVGRDESVLNLHQ